MVRLCMTQRRLTTLNIKNFIQMTTSNKRVRVMLKQQRNKVKRLGNKRCPHIKTHLTKVIN